MSSSTLDSLLKKLGLKAHEVKRAVLERSRAAMMAVNPYVHVINKYGSHFSDKVSDSACYVGNESRLVRSRQNYADRVNYIYKDKCRFINCKRNVNGLRR